MSNNGNGRLRRLLFAALLAAVLLAAAMYNTAIRQRINATQYQDVELLTPVDVCPGDEMAVSWDSEVDGPVWLEVKQTWFNLDRNFSPSKFNREFSIQIPPIRIETRTEIHPTVPELTPGNWFFIHGTRSTTLAPPTQAVVQIVVREDCPQ